MVNTNPVAAAGVNSGTICTGTTINLTSSGGASYSWTGPGNYKSTEQNPNIPNASSAMSGTYTVTVTSTNGCTDSEQISLTVTTLPVVTIASSADPLCISAQRTLTGFPAGGIFTLTDGPASISGNILSPTGTGTVSLMYTYTSGCSNSVSQSVSIAGNPVVDAGPDKELNFVNETQMEAVLNTSEAGEWSIISGSGIISDNNSPGTKVTNLAAGQNILLWTVKNNGCETSDEVVIKVNEIFIPSVMTPNNDGKNDYFELKPLVGKIEFIIFNQWGVVEYSNSSYLNNWDGRNKKGLELPEDTYFYVVKFENGIIRKGTILIRR